LFLNHLFIPFIFFMTDGLLVSACVIIPASDPALAERALRG